MPKLTEYQTVLAKKLIWFVNNGDYKVTYKRLVNSVGKKDFRRVGKEIGEVSKLCVKHGFPPLSAIVVRSDTHRSGVGFTNLCKELNLNKPSESDKEMYKRLHNDVISFTQWSNLEKILRAEF